MEYILLIVGFGLLIKGADFFVEGASSIAAKLKIPSLIIGLTVVSMGTSMPEAAVSISASLNGSNGISLGNVIGSNIFNLLVVVGISSIILAIATDKDILKRDMPISIFVTAVLCMMLADGHLSRLDAGILLLLFVGYLILLIYSALKNRTQGTPQRIHSWAVSLMLSVLGVAAIIGGGQLVVNSASAIAISLGMGETLVGLTIVAVGTSLPELVTSIAAARKGDPGIAMGNVVGSNIFNILFILGLAGVIQPMAAEPAFFVDTAILIAVSFVMLFFAHTDRKTSRAEGIIATLMYVAYMVYIIMRAYQIWIF